MNERTIFLQALEQTDATARSEFLAKACGDDTALRQRVEQLLQSHGDAGSFLATPALGGESVGAPTPEGVTDTHTAVPVNGADDIPLDFLTPPRNAGSLGQLDHYEVQAAVGRGGMGVVLRAFDEKLHRVVALKVMAPAFATNAPARKRFSREAKAAAAVVHDHIVPIHAIEEAGSMPYLVMQFIEGQSLQQKIDAEGSLELKEILRIGMQIASGLSAAHKQGLVHRDIKPSNILLENGVQRVKITDFGLARTVDDASLSQSGVVAGTPQYMSPEQADGQAVDHRSDLFSLGSVFYAMCTGRPPFRSASTVATLKRVCEDTPRPIPELNPDIPAWLCDIIAKLHAKNPGERFGSAKEVAEVLEQHLAQVQRPCQVTMPAVVLPPTPAAQSGRGSSLAGWFGLACSGALIVLLYGGYGLLQKPTGLSLPAWVLPSVLIAFGMIALTMAQRLERQSSRQSALTWFALLQVLIGSGLAMQWLRDEAVNRDPDEASRASPDTNRQHVAQELEAGWVRLFNGTDLAGWKTHPDQPGDWKVEAGILTGRDGPSHLFTERGDYYDFHLRAEAKINTQGDSGIWFWTSLDLPTTSPRTGLRYPAGYEVQIIGRPEGDEDGRRTGSIIPQAPTRTALMKPDEWFTLEVIAKGNHLTTKVNGRTAAELEPLAGMRLGAHIALQSGGSRRPTSVQFRRVEIKVLPLDQPEASGIPPDAGVLTLQFEPGNYSEKVRRFGVVVQIRKSTGDRPAQAILRLGEKVATTYAPGDYTLDLNEPGELELSRTKVKLGPKAEEFITVRRKSASIDKSSNRPSLDGRWVFVAAEYQGRQVPSEDAKDTYPSELRLKGDLCDCVTGGKTHEGGLRTDPSKDPAEIDFTSSALPGFKPCKAIYEVTGDHLRLCLPFGEPNSDPPRPTNFKTDPQSKTVLLTYRREN